MFILYDLVFFIFALLYLPLYLLRGKFHQGFCRRLGVLPADLNLDKPVWVHAVSVGEAIAVRKLLDELRKLYPLKKFVISTVTPTGNKVAKGMLRPGDFLTYLPLDFSFIVQKVIKEIKPQVFVIAETELWPNLIYCLRKFNIPMVTVNARISNSSYHGYKRIKFLIKPVLRKINLLCAQSQIDADRLIDLGADAANVRVTGNMKYDINLNVVTQGLREELRAKLSLKDEDVFFVCGSTHRGEEEIILGAYKELLAEFPRLKLLIAPRHPERTGQISVLINNFGFEAIRVSELKGDKPQFVTPAQAGVLDPRFRGDDSFSQTVYILDTIGQLMNYYAAADIVFVGGSLIKKGGHNILEPASLKKPVLFGPQMFNFRDIAELFLKEKAAFLIVSESDLAEKLKFLLENPLLTGELGARGYALIGKNSGATEKNAQLIKKLLGG